MKNEKMVEIRIPFKPRFKDKMLGGIKEATWRTEKYEDVGDRLPAFGAWFELVDVHPAPMSDVVRYWLREGFEDPTDAIRFMQELRPKRGYDEDYPGWHHWFKKIGMQR